MSCGEGLKASKTIEMHSLREIVDKKRSKKNYKRKYPKMKTKGPKTHLNEKLIIFTIKFPMLSNPCSGKGRTLWSHQLQQECPKSIYTLKMWNCVLIPPIRIRASGHETFKNITLVALAGYLAFCFGISHVSNSKTWKANLPFPW
jgi:hypothetical protein